MIVPVPGSPHLTYCTNIHPGETWTDVRANLKTYVTAVKARIAPTQAFGVGLRLSAQAAEALAAPREIEALQAFLKTGGLYVFTINGFPYGAFHGQRIKEAVFLPDWLEPARLDYSDRLARLLARLLPPGVEGSVSTSPGAFKARVTSEKDAARMAELMLRHVATLHAIREETGKVVTLAIEPEPFGYVETVAETIAFFERHLVSREALARVADLTGLGRAQSEALVRHHLGVCFDACHMAVEFEEPRAALDAFRRAGIRIPKVQVSAGLRVLLGGDDHGRLAALRPFAEGVYLHQVVERRGTTLQRYLDLPEALDAAGPAGAREWRIHFHVPLFRAELGPFLNTQEYLSTLLGILRHEAVTPHLEIETYTWDVLPEEYRREDIVTAVARELRWVINGLTA